MMAFNNALNKVVDNAVKLVLVVFLGKNYKNIIGDLWKDVTAF